MVKKTTKEEFAVAPVEEAKDTTVSEENGEVEEKTLKKTKTKKIDNKPSTEPSRKSSRAPKPVLKENENSQPKEAAKKGKKRAASKSPAKAAKRTKAEKEDYEVDGVVGFRINKGKKEFKIRWKGYKPSDDSWEPEKNLSCQDLIKEYEENHKDEMSEASTKKNKSTPAKKTSAKSKRGKSAKSK